MSGGDVDATRAALTNICAAAANRRATALPATPAKAAPRRRPPSAFAAAGHPHSGEASLLCWAHEADVGDAARALRRVDLKVGVRYFGPLGSRVVRVSESNFHVEPMVEPGSPPAPDPLAGGGTPAPWFCAGPSSEAEAVPSRRWRRVELPAKGVKVPWVFSKRPPARGATAAAARPAVLTEEKDEAIRALSADLGTQTQAVAELEAVVSALRDNIDRLTSEHRAVKASPVSSPARPDIAAGGSPQQRVAALESMLREQLEAATGEILQLQDDLAQERQRQGSSDSNAAIQALQALQRLPPDTPAGTASTTAGTQTEGGGGGGGGGGNRGGEAGRSSAPAVLGTLPPSEKLSPAAAAAAAAAAAHFPACAPTQCHHQLCPAATECGECSSASAVSGGLLSSFFSCGQPVKVRSKTWIWRDAVVVRQPHVYTPAYRMALCPADF